ncbi:GNAT family N-acetyltransferase [uncultured Anaerococcus sp.]|uniref:GNAT family N-acetyltransferase n=1 Tax=uncultured Anaerococcus sp. TaxID=293428 RepID=UPI0025E6167C|nr:GNAT family N-acetyltransferase [uncultured Anaerococcus sp.]
MFYIVYKNELVGDCAIFDYNMVAIVISNDHRGDNLGSKVLKRLISYAREKKLLYLKAEIYEFNHISRI